LDKRFLFGKLNFTQRAQKTCIVQYRISFGQFSEAYCQINVSHPDCKKKGKNTFYNATDKFRIPKGKTFLSILVFLL